MRWVLGQMLTAALVCAACTGDIGDSDSESGSKSEVGSDPGASTTGGSVAVTPQALIGSLGNSVLRTLTSFEYRNSIRDLLGKASADKVVLEPDVQLNGLTAIGSSSLAVSARATELYEQSATDLADLLLSDTTARKNLVGCDPAASGCIDTFLGNFGSRLWRRPLSSQELARYKTLASAATASLTDPWEGVRYALHGLLQSPNFLYRAELGTPEAGGSGRLVLNDYELASRLSYFLLGTTPDAELLTAAAAGTLSESRATQVTRLLALPSATTSVQNLFGEYLGLARLDATTKLGSLFPAFTDSLKAAMRTETTLTLTTLAFQQNADFRSLFTTHTSYVNSELGTLYGVSATSGGTFGTVTFPASSPRVGLLGQASLLAMNAHAATTSPTLRGKFVRQVLLCEAIPPPPANVNTTLPDTGTAQTTRQKVEAHSTNATCAACHKMMDPVGLGLENFDAIGRYRDTENGNAIDASGDLDGVKYSGPAGLAQAVADHPNLPSCFVRTLYRQGSGTLEAPEQDPLITALTSQFSTGGYQVRAFLGALVNHDAFTHVTPLPEQP